MDKVTYYGVFLTLTLPLSAPETSGRVFITQEKQHNFGSHAYTLLKALKNPRRTLARLVHTDTDSL